MAKEVQTKVKFSYNHSSYSSRKVTVDVKHDVTVWLTGDITTVLGFDKDSIIQKKTSSLYVNVADFTGEFSSMYVYTDILGAQIVGHFLVRLPYPTPIRWK